MEEYKKLSVTVGAYYEIRDAELYGGIGSVGYASWIIGGDGEILRNDLEGHVSGQKESIAAALGVPEGCVRVITKEEYEGAMREEP